MIGEIEAVKLETDACFVIDHNQKIVLWSDPAGKLLGIADDSVIGRECASVVGGRSPSGDPVCRMDCPALKATREGLLGHASPMMVESDGKRVSLACKVVNLSGQMDGALITLAGAPPGATFGWRPMDAESATVASDELAAVGSLAANYDPDMARSSADHTLDWLRQTLCVEAAELFLREPGSDDMLLSNVRSTHESAFTEINRFRPGEGFPGLVLSRGAALRTRDLQADERYLRSRVKAEGFLSYLCVPLRGSEGIIGSLNIAARRSDLDFDGAQNILEWVGLSLAANLESASLKARLNAVPQPNPNNIDGELEVLSRHLLRQMMGVGNASAGELIVHYPNLGGTMHRVASGRIEKALCPDIIGVTTLACPALIGQRGIVLQGRRVVWPSPCQHMGGTSSVTQCIPIVAHGEYVGLSRLQYQGNIPSPPTNHLTVLQAIATQAALSVKQARDAAMTDASLDLGAGPAHSVNGRRELPGIGGALQDGVDEPYLKIRCFGSFELYREGRLLPPDAVKRRGALVLLKILLSNDGRPVSRDVLIEALWPGADPGVAANRLYVLIHALRRAIEPSSHRHKRRWTFICNDGDRYYISTDAPYRCDIRDFRRAVELGGRQERSGDRRGAVDSYGFALDLYTGDLFEDEPYAEWCWAERENLRETALDIAVKIARQHHEWSSPDESIIYYRRALRIDPLREQIHRGLIEALLAVGRRSDAQRQYSICAELLLRELGIEPMPETQRIQQKISFDPS
jgi:DNA-binding SARP family transcriptional activator